MADVEPGPGGELYDRIGSGYAHQRRAEPRWSAAIAAAIGSRGPLLNVGAGSGSYEPADVPVIAVEPAISMILQRPAGAAPPVCARAEHLPFADASFAVATAILTVHHWSDAGQGLRELRRVASRQIVVTWDPAVFASSFWLVRDYLPEISEHEADKATLAEVRSALGAQAVVPLPVPANCRDGFLGAFWSTPEAYLRPEARRAMSGLALLDPRIVDAALDQLRGDLASGAWRERNAELAGLDELDLGYRLVVADTGSER